MARYNLHPAQGGGHYHNVKYAKNRVESLEEKKLKQHLLKLKRKRRKGR